MSYTNGVDTGITLDMQEMLMREPGSDFWSAVDSLCNDYAAGNTRYFDGNYDDDNFDEVFYAHPVHLIGNWYYGLEQPWEYTDFLL